MFLSYILLIISDDKSRYDEKSSEKTGIFGNGSLLGHVSEQNSLLALVSYQSTLFALNLYIKMWGYFFVNTHFPYNIGAFVTFSTGLNARLRNEPSLPQPNQATAQVVIVHSLTKSNSLS